MLSLPTLCENNVYILPHTYANNTYLYSGFTFSHYDLRFPTRYCIPYVRFLFYFVSTH